MHIAYFTEQPYPELNHEDAWKLHDFDHMARQPGHNVLLHSNRFFDSHVAARLFDEYLTQYTLAEEAGYDGIMVNEHHNAAYCMQSRISIMSAVLAARTQNVKIVQLGNPLPTWENPVQLAEEIGMIDMISKGRIVSGIVRAGGQEQISNNVNPAFNRERFREAHDLMIKTWTDPGPFRWEGDHYQVRVVNPWATPYQKPHPRIWCPGIVSKETIEFAAAHRYPYICLNTTIDDTKRIWGLYDKLAAQAGFVAGPQYRGYLVRCIVGETEEEARRIAQQHMWMAGEFAGFGRSAWVSPTGYTSYENRMGRAAWDSKLGDLDYQISRGTMVVGTPDQVIKKLRWWMEETRPGIMILWQLDGKIPFELGNKSIRMMGREVLPAVKEIAKELDLKDPFEANDPVSLASSPPETLIPGATAAE